MKINGGSGNDLLNGSTSNDTINGGAGNNTLIGGLGADSLIGGAGVDIFRYSKGGGNDVIAKASTNAAATNDVLELTNIKRSEVTFSVFANDFFSPVPESMKINIAGGGSILLDEFLDGTNEGRIASIKFSDGTIMTSAQIIQAVAAIMGTSSNNTLNGTASNNPMMGFNGADSLSGAAGNDSIYGQNGADTLRGGIGADLMMGGEDSDTYIYSRGDGDDVLADFGYNSSQDMLVLNDVARSDVSFVAVDADSNAGTESIKMIIQGGGSIILKENLTQGFYNTIESVKFSDGTTMTANQLSAATTLFGTANSEQLYGDRNDNNISALGGNDQLIGDDGNDSLSGDAGNDTIWGEIGNDTINGGDGADQLLGGVGADNIRGGSGNDSIWGEDNNDVIRGDTGVDILVGGAGGDRFVFNKGDTGIGANMDTITDFSRSQGDKISLAGYGLSASGFVGTKAMKSGGAVEFGYSKVALYNYTIIKIDADNNGVSDQEIQLTGVSIDLLATDFVF